MLPQFPLKIVVFPGEQLNLHIFEPRYKQLINECEAEDRTFGIPAFIEKRVMEIGTEVRLEKIVKRHPNGEMDIRTRGVGLFRIVEFCAQAPGKLYGAAEVSPLPVNERGGDPLQARLLLNRIKELFHRLELNKPVPADPVELRTFPFGHQLGLTLEQEYQLLQLPTESERQTFLIEHLDRLLPLVQEMEEVRRKAKMNGHFRNVIPPS